MSLVAENLARLRHQLKEFPDVKIMGVTKKQSAETIREGIAAGIDVLGNNYAQEGDELMNEVAGKVEWHFIGHIQSRKVKFLPRYQMVQSLDRLELAKSLGDKMHAQGKKMPVLVEINIGEEPQKSGVMPAAFDNFLNEVRKFSGIEVAGIMGMPPPLNPIDERRPYFKKLRQLYDKHSFRVLSMGTSEDFLVAAQEGSTMLRVGTILFGERPSK